MSHTIEIELSSKIVAKAKYFGADLVGFANIESLKFSPSNTIFSQLPLFRSVNTRSVRDRNETVVSKNQVKWPDDTKAIVVLALCHPEDEESLDFWRDPFSGCTEGNLELIRITSTLKKWLEESYGVAGKPIPYDIEYGGFFLKDASVLAGFGVIGKNNMLVTPQFGPRVRLRALGLPLDISSTGQLDFDPCDSCDHFCRKVCPVGAYDQQIFSSVEYSQNELPAREGVYDRKTCNVEMERNIRNATTEKIDGKDELMRVVSYCRKCEFACPVGR